MSFVHEVDYGTPTSKAEKSVTLTIAGRACVQACPTATLNEKSDFQIGTPEHSVVTTCAYCGVGCSFKAEMRGDEVVRMVPYKNGKANRGHSCVKGRFAWTASSNP